MFCSLITSEKAPYIKGPSSPAVNPEKESTIETVPAYFQPRGGWQNRLLNSLVERGIIDENYRLIKDLSTLKLPKLNPLQIEVIRDFLDSDVNVNVSIENSEFTCSFKVRDLLLDLYNKRTQDVERIEIVGGLIRRILLFSPEYCNEALKTLGVETTEALVTEECLKSKGGYLPDVDTRYRCSKSQEMDLCNFTHCIVEFLSQKMASLSEYAIQSSAFSKFNKVNEENTVFTIASFGKFKLSKLSELESELECIFAKDFNRENLFVHDAYYINILLLLLSLTASEKEELPELLLESREHTGWQPLIDNFGKVLHVNNPTTVDIAGIPMLVSYISRGYVLGDGVVIDDSGEHPIKVDVLEAMLRTFLTLTKSYKTLPIQVASSVMRCLQNHHQDDPNAPLIYFYNLLNQIHQQAPAEVVKAVEEAIKGNHDLKSKNEDSVSLPYEIFQAITEKGIPFEVVNAVITVGGFHLLGMIGVEEQDPTACLRRHRGEPYIQLRTGPASSSYLLIPFKPAEALRILEKFLSGQETSEDHYKTLAGIFNRVISFPMIDLDSVPVIEAHADFFKDEYAEVLEAGSALLSENTSLLSYIFYHALLPLGGHPSTPLKLFEYFPATVFSKYNLGKGPELLKKVSGAVSRSKYAFMACHLENPEKTIIELLGEKQDARQFLQEWLELLAKSQDLALCEQSLKLWDRYSGKYSEKRRTEFSFKLISFLLPAGFSQAQRLFLGMQSNRNSSFSRTKEMEGITQLLSCLVSSKTKETFPLDLRSMISIYDKFLLNCQQEALKPPQVTSEFRKHTEAFVEQLVQHGFLQEVKQVLELATEFKLITLSKTSELWISLCRMEMTAQGSSPLHSFETWRRAKSLGIWKGDLESSVYNPFILSLSEILTAIPKHEEEGYRLLRHIAKRKIEETTLQRKTRVLAVKHLDKVLESREESDNDKAVRMMVKEYKGVLTQSQSMEYTLKLLERYIVLNSYEKAIVLWRRLLSTKGRDEKLPAIAEHTAMLLTALLKDKTNTKNINDAVSMMTHSNFPELMPYLTRISHTLTSEGDKAVEDRDGVKDCPESLRECEKCGVKPSWMNFANQVLQFSIELNAAKRPEAEKICCVILDHGIDVNTTPPSVELWTFLGSLHALLEEYSSTGTPLTDELIDKLQRQADRVVKLYYSRKQFQKVCSFIVLVDKLKVAASLDKEVAECCLNSIRKVSLLTKPSELDIVPYENCLKSLEISECLKVTLANEDILDCCAELSKAYVRAKNYTHAIEWALRIMERDKECVYKDSYCSLCMAIVERDFSAGIRFLASLDQNYPESTVFIPVIKSAVEVSQTLPSAAQLEFFRTHRSLLLKAFNEVDLTQRVCATVTRAMSSSPSSKEIHECLNAMSSYPPNDPKYCADFLACIKDCEDPGVIKQAWKVFDSEFLAHCPLDEAPELLAECWHTMIQALVKIKCPTLIQLVRELSCPDSKITRGYRHCDDETVIARGWTTLMQGALSLLKNQKKCSKEDLEYLLKGLEKADRLKCSEPVKEKVFSLAFDIFDHLLGSCDSANFLTAAALITKILERLEKAQAPTQMKRTVSAIQDLLKRGAGYDFHSAKNSRSHSTHSDIVPGLARVVQAARRTVKREEDLLEICRLMIPYRSGIIAEVLESCLNELLLSCRVDHHESEATVSTPLGKVIAAYLASRVESSDKSAHRSVHNLLAHENIASHLTPKELGYIWGRHLPMHVKSMYPEEHSGHKVMAVHSLINSYEKVRHSREGADHWANAIIDILAPLILEESSVIIFNELLYSFFKALLAQDNDWLTYEEEDTILSFKTPIFYCNRQIDKSKSNSTFSSRFFRYMNTVITTLISLDCKDDRSHTLINHFVSCNLTRLMSCFPERGEDLADTIHKYCFWVMPEKTDKFVSHISYAGAVLAEGILRNLFASSPEKLVEAMMYLDAKTCFPPGYPMKKQADILLNLTERLLKVRNPLGALRVVQILHGIQCILSEHHPAGYHVCYERLIDKIEEYPTDIHDDRYFFESVRSALMNRKTIACINGTKEGFNTANSLCTRLFNAVYSQLTDKKAFEGVEEVITMWLVELIEEALQYGAFHGREGNENYFILLEKILPLTTQYLHRVKAISPDKFIEYTYLAICGMEDHQTDIGKKIERKYCPSYSKSIKEKRAWLLAKWLLRLTQCDEGKYKPLACEIYLKAKGQGLFIGKTAKEEIKQLEKLSSK